MCEAPIVEIEWDISAYLGKQNTVSPTKTLQRVLLAPPVRDSPRRQVLTRMNSSMNSSISCPSISVVDSPQAFDTSDHWYADSPAYPPTRRFQDYPPSDANISPSLEYEGQESFPSISVRNHPVSLLRLEEGNCPDMDDIMGPHQVSMCSPADFSIYSDATAFMDAPLCKRAITEKVKKRSLAKSIKHFAKRLNKLPTLSML